MREPNKVSLMNGVELRPPSSVRDVAFILFKFKWSALAILLITLVSALVYVVLIRDTLYDAESKLMVRIGQEQAPPSTLVGQMPMVMGYRYQDVNTEIDILQSADLLSRVVDKFGLDKPTPPAPPPPGLLPRIRYEVKRVVQNVKDTMDTVLITIGMREKLSDREKAIYALQHGFIVVPQKDSNVLVAHLLLPARKGVAPVLNGLIDEYLDFRLKLYYSDKTRPFFESENAEASARLHAAEAKLQDFEQRWGISALDRQKSLLLDRQSGAEQLMREAKIKLDDAQDKVQRLDAQLRKPEPEIGALGSFDTGELPQRLIGELADLQKEREQLRMTALDNDPRIVNNRSRFHVVLGLIASNLRVTLAERQAAYSARQGAYDDASRDLQALHDKQTEWEVLTRQRKLAEETFLATSKKLEEATTEAALDAQKLGNVVVIERAIDPLMPTGMRKLTMIGISAVLALFAALAWVSIAEFFDQGIYSVRALAEAIEAPVLGAIPRTRRRGLRRWLRAGPAVEAARIS